MSLPTSKRRKLENNSNTVLFKPFKSPMRVSSPESPSKPQVIEQSDTKILEKQDLVTAKVPQCKLPRQVDSPKLDDSEAKELSSLRREESRLLGQLSRLKAELAQIKQAEGIKKSQRDIELTGLIKLWKSASQQAAEEIYSTMRDKVNAIGGMRRWREMEKSRMENAYSNWGTDADGKFDGQDADIEEQEDGSDGEKRPNIDEEDEQAEIQESESFSMDVMLRYLNIQLDVIGYDVQEQRWIT